MAFSTGCRSCPRLANFLDQVREAHPDCYALPVSSFGGADSKYLIVGRAPGMHVTNRTEQLFFGNSGGATQFSAGLRELM